MLYKTLTLALAATAVAQDAGATCRDLKAAYQSSACCGNNLQSVTDYNLYQGANECHATSQAEAEAAEALAPFVAAKAEVKSFTEPELAAINWFQAFINALSFNDVPISQGGTLSNCRYILRNQYAADATVDLQLPNGGSAPRVVAATPACDMGLPCPMFEGINILPLADCILFGGVDHHTSFMGQAGIINVEYCPTADGKGLWKGQDVPFRDATGNSMNVDPSWFEDVGRWMFLKGSITAEGYLKAEKLTMCVGVECDLSRIPYASEWTC